LLDEVFVGASPVGEGEDVIVHQVIDSGFKDIERRRLATRTSKIMLTENLIGSRRGRTEIGHEQLHQNPEQP